MPYLTLLPVPHAPPNRELKNKDFFFFPVTCLGLVFLSLENIALSIRRVISRCEELQDPWELCC